MKRKPVIGITMRLEIPSDRFYLARHYSEALCGSGAVALHIPLIPDEEHLTGILGCVDGLLLPGSDSDTDPALYGEEPHPKLGRVVPERDRTDLLLLSAAEDRRIPLFAICYGMQALNVSRGGSLIQDIESQTKEPIKHEQGEPWNNESHGIRIQEGSGLAALAGAPGARVNSHHHQAVGRLGENLVATAWASDGIVECVEDTRSDRFVMGVQWHPELSWRRDPLSGALFRRFVEAASSDT